MKTANPALNLALSGRWTLCDQAPRSALYLKVSLLIYPYDHDKSTLQYLRGR